MESSSGMGGNACAGINKEDQKRLDEAAQMFVDARGVIISITDAIGHFLSGAGDSIFEFLRTKLGIDFKFKAEAAVQQALWQLQSVFATGLEDTADAEQWNWFHKLLAGASGATGGFFGAPGMVWDLPLTTGIIMRSVADIARSFPDESLGSDETKLACIEVFAMGGPETDDDDADAGYWAARAALSHLAIEKVVQVAAVRMGLQLAEKTVAQIVPIAGMVTGASLNYAFVDYYQQMARVHFIIRGVERRAADPSSVRACFSSRVREVRERRKRRKAA